MRRVEVSVCRIEGDDHERVFHCLRNLQTLPLHSLRQLWKRLLQLVLHLHLGHIAVCAGRERKIYLHVAEAVTCRTHVKQVIQALHLLFNDLRDALVHHLGGGSRVLPEY